MNTDCSRGLAAPLWTVCLLVALALPRQSPGHEKLTFAFAENAPPYSFSSEERAAGLLPDLVQLVFSMVPGYTADSAVMPWARAQYNVRFGDADGFLTYPSRERRDYAVFSAEPLFTQDFGHLVYSADNPNIAQIESATSFADLAGLKVIVEKGSKWEDENIPGYLERVPGRDVDTMMHLLMLRKAGDFLVQPAEDARFIAGRLGYLDNLKVRKVDFIPNALIPFHLGVARSLPFAEEVIGQVDEVMADPDFRSQQSRIIASYR